jgi:integral membrane protein
MLGNSLTRLRLFSAMDGLSFLILIGIAMPLKYIAGDPTFVRYVGMTHGVLFILFIASLLDTSMRYQWNVKFSLFCFFCSLIPFAPFWLEGKLKLRERN